MGEHADFLIDQMLFGDGSFDEYGEYLGDHRHTPRPRRRREATEVAEEVLNSVKGNRNVKKLNEGVIKW